MGVNFNYLPVNDTDMKETGGSASEEPILQPRVIRFLKNRPRLIDRGFREEFLEQLESNVSERRKPDTLAEKTVRGVFRNLEEAGSGVAKNKAQGALNKANDGPLSRL